MDWFRSSVIEAIKKISKEHKLEALENYDLWLLYSSMCFKNLNKNDWQDNIEFWINDFTYERKKEKNI